MGIDECGSSVFGGYVNFKNSCAVICRLEMNLTVF